jgi:hypothetical protein
MSPNTMLQLLCESDVKHGDRHDDQPNRSLQRRTTAAQGMGISFSAMVAAFGGPRQALAKRLLL